MFCSSESRESSFAAAFLDRWQAGRPAGERGQRRMLDVGTGSARIPIALAAGGLETEIVAVDRAPGALRRAAERFGRAGFHDRVRLVLADAQSLPFADHSFDAVMSNGLVHHVTDRSAVLREMLRVLRPGGLFFIRDSLRQPDAAAIERVLAGESAQNGRAVAGSTRLSAPLAMPEVTALLESARLPAAWLQQSGRQHWIVCGQVAR